MVVIEPALGSVAATGTRSVSPASSVTYTATATGPGGTATDSVRVTVNVGPQPAAAAPPRTPDVSIEELFRTSVRPIYFDYDRFEIRADQVGQLRQNAQFVRQNAAVRFTIGGHADERGTQEYNIGLADRRANAVRTFLLDEGIAASRIETVSYGEERPTCREANERCWSQNRRAEFAIRQ
jgi:peptidoglycan-associated lipoprotein